MSQTLFKVVYADPPWYYNKWNGADNKSKKARGMADSYYQTMKTADIADLPVAKFTAKDSVLLMWATWPCLKDALQVGEAWGFTYKTNAFLWAKTSSARGDSFLTATDGWHFGLGSWSRGNTEFCLLFTKGKPKRASNAVPQLLVAPVGKHSAKPHEAYNRIEQLLEGPYVELFSRNERPGWVSLGNEINGLDISDAISNLARPLISIATESTLTNVS